VEDDVKIIGKNALVVEGGAMRGIFSTGMLDAFLESGFNPFDLCIGVSAGSTNIAAYLAEMPKRNYKVYIDYSTRSEFISFKKFIRGGHLVDLDWLWDITINELRLDLQKIVANKSKFLIGVTKIETGKVIYVEPNVNNLEYLLKASSSIPILYRSAMKVSGIDVVDGGIGDPIPVIEAYNRGARNIMVIRSRPHNYTMKKSSNSFLNKFLYRKHPQLVSSIIKRSKTYEDSIAFMRNPPMDINIFEINPPSSFKTKRLTTDVSILKKDYDTGYATGFDAIKKWLNVFGDK